eukprot:s989_g18.t3
MVAGALHTDDRLTLVRNVRDRRGFAEAVEEWIEAGREDVSMQFAEAVEEWIEAGREDVSMQSLADRVFEHPPTDIERRLMEGMMAEWHAADLADVRVYEDDLCSDRIEALAKARRSLLDEDGDEEHWKIVGGHQGLAAKMAKDLDLSLSTVVQKVEWAGDRVCMECQSSETSFFCSTHGCDHRAAGVHSRYHLRTSIPSCPRARGWRWSGLAEGCFGPDGTKESSRLTSEDGQLTNISSA